MNEYKNKRFGRIIAIEPVGRDRHRNVLWRCECDCGKESIVRAADLKRTKSCGCLSSELTANRNRTQPIGTKRSALTPQELDALKSRWGEAQPLGGDKGD